VQESFDLQCSIHAHKHAHTVKSVRACAPSHAFTSDQVLLLVPPSPGNLAAYASWAAYGGRDGGLLLADGCTGVVRLEVRWWRLAV
jgi:hypothetical protein